MWASRKGQENTKVVSKAPLLTTGHSNNSSSSFDEFGQLMLNASSREDNDHGQIAEILESLNSVCNQFPIGNGYTTRNVDFLLGSFAPSNKRYNIVINGISPCYHESVNKAFQGKLNSFNAEKIKESEIGSRAAIAEMLKCIKEENPNSSCFMNPLARVTKNSRGPFAVSQQLSMTHYPNTLVGDIKEIDEEGRAVKLDIVYYSGDIDHVTSRHNAIKNRRFDLRNLGKCNEVLRMLNYKLKENSYVA